MTSFIVETLLLGIFKAKTFMKKLMRFSHFFFESIKATVMRHIDVRQYYKIARRGGGAVGNIVKGAK